MMQAANWIWIHPRTRRVASLCLGIVVAIALLLYYKATSPDLYIASVALLASIVIGVSLPVLILEYIASLVDRDTALQQTMKIAEDASNAWRVLAQPEASEFLHALSRLSNEHKASAPFGGSIHAFIRCYLQGHTRDLQDFRIHTNTEAFTQLYSALTEYLLDTEPAKGTRGPHRFCRVHLTGMLPEDFYNGPQIAYESTDSASVPRIICRQWEKYDAFKQGQVPNELRVIRYVLVRDDATAHNPLISALSTYRELQQQAELVIKPVARSFLDLERSEHPEVLYRLLRKSYLQLDNTAHALVGTYPPSPEAEAAAKSLVGRITQRDAFHYYPILGQQDVESDESMGSALAWENFFQRFARDFHSISNPDADSRYCRITERSFASIKDSALGKCLKPGHVPEVVLFGDTKLKNWYFGLLALYRPFTYDIEVSFVSSQLATEQFKDILAVAEESGGALSSLSSGRG